MLDMTPLCGYNMGAASTTPAAPVGPTRTKQTITPTEGGTVQILDDGHDGMTILTPAAPLAMVNLVLPLGGDDLQTHRIASMQDIAAIQFAGGTVLNTPTELLANQAVTIQRIDKPANTWISI